MREDSFGYWVYIFVAMCVLAFSECRGYLVDSSEACRTAQTLGMRDCVVTGAHQLVPSWYGCGHDDAVGFDVSATGPFNQHANAIVCCGWLMKACTLRVR